MGEQTYPYLEDIMVETKTHRKDWLVGLQEIADYVGYSLSGMSYAVSNGKIPGIVKVFNTNRAKTQPYMYCMLVKLADKVKERLAAKPELNGNSQPPVQMVVPKEVVPIASQQDIRMLALEISNLKQAIKENTQALHEMTEELRPKPYTTSK